MTTEKNPDHCIYCGQYVGFSFDVHVHLAHPEHCLYIPKPTMADPKKKKKAKDS